MYRSMVSYAERNNKLIPQRPNERTMATYALDGSRRNAWVQYIQSMWASETTSDSDDDDDDDNDDEG
ncbi:hypothetical protein LTR56_011217 [Elasticomyces elasticus]|nr:hypothetical protein LTR56_011217 [Elasticomyces elasticus]KAK3650419.1 hypothetical protein LTR22_012509 [Elasticomyces elasticus]KAK4921848.1 hypothetical protein LTR49_010787 [Elasticomyces elasticus]KAK5751426.1 hypothetical protein LTS12_018514 [Elasticomyces elasticus]